MLKLKLLASRLNSDCLEEWVRLESTGYPDGQSVPEYRIVNLSYRASFQGPFGAAIQNAPIPSALIRRFAGDRWNTYQIRESISAVDELLKTSLDKDENVGIDASNLILILQGKVYPGYACVDVRATLSSAALAEIRHTVRGRILDLTIELERSIPASADVVFGPPLNLDKNSAATVNQITNHVIYGDVGTFTSGSGSSFQLTIEKRDKNSLIESLIAAGIPDEDAREFISIIASEEPTDQNEPLGTKGKNWIAKNIKKAAEGAWEMGVTVATKVLSDAASTYYGLK